MNHPLSAPAGLALGLIALVVAAACTGDAQGQRDVAAAGAAAVSEDAPAGSANAAQPTTRQIRAASQPAREVTPEGCTIVRFQLRAKRMDRDVWVSVMLPPQYEKEAMRTFPVLFGLHGARAPYDAFVNMSPLRRAMAEKPFIVVAYDGDDFGWYVDSPERPDSQFQSFLIDDLIPHLDRNYRTNGRRAITGFSMGGYGALHSMLVAPDLFYSVSGLSAAVGHFGEAEVPHRSVASIFGPYAANREVYEKHQVLRRIAERLKQGKPLVPIMLRCGTEDTIVRYNRAFRDGVKALIDTLPANQKAGVVFEYEESPGGHNWPYWRDQSAHIVDFHWKHLPPPVVRP